MYIEQKTNKIYQPQGNTTLSAEETNQQNTELQNLITAGGLTPSAGTLTQVRDAVQNIVNTSANYLQQQIDAITSASDVFDVVGTYAELQAYDKTTVPINDIIKVLQDSTHNNAATYYRLVEESGGGTDWQYIGSEGPYYTKSEIDTAFATKAELPSIATTAQVGLVKPDGSTVLIDQNGTISVSGVQPDGISITPNTNSELQAIGVINQNNTSSAIKSWSGTKAQYDAIPNKDANTLYNVTDETSAYIGTGKSIGEVYLSQSSSAVDNPGGLPLFTGELISNANNLYPQFYAWVLAHTELCKTQAEYDTAISTYGECPYYVIDDTNKTILLPKLVNYLKMANTTDKITQAAAGLPNITGAVNSSFLLDFSAGSVQTSALQGSASGTPSQISTGNAGSIGNRLNLDASNSSSIYGNSDTVTPAHTTLYPWVCAYNAAITASVAQAAQFENALISKSDTDLSNVNSTGKATAIQWGLPDYANGITVQNTASMSGSYTPTQAGEFHLSILAGIGSTTFKINTIAVGCQKPSTSNLYSVSYCVRVAKDDVIAWTCSSSTNMQAYFYPFKGN